MNLKNVKRIPFVKYLIWKFDLLVFGESLYLNVPIYSLLAVVLCWPTNKVMGIPRYCGTQLCIHMIDCKLCRMRYLPFYQNIEISIISIRRSWQSNHHNGNDIPRENCLHIGTGLVQSFMRQGATGADHRIRPWVTEYDIFDVWDNVSYPQTRKISEKATIFQTSRLCSFPHMGEPVSIGGRGRSKKACELLDIKLLKCQCCIKCHLSMYG